MKEKQIKWNRFSLILFHFDLDWIQMKRRESHEKRTKCTFDVRIIAAFWHNHRHNIRIVHFLSSTLMFDKKKMTKSSVDIHDVDYAGWKCDINWNHLIEDGESNCSNEMFLSLDNMFRLCNNVIISFNNKISLLVHLKYIKPTNDLYAVKKTSGMRKSCTYDVVSNCWPYFLLPKAFRN